MPSKKKIVKKPTKQVSTRKKVSPKKNLKVKAKKSVVVPRSHVKAAPEKTLPQSETVVKPPVRPLKYVKEIFGWALAVTSILAVITVIAEYGSQGSSQNNSIADMTQASLLSQENDSSMPTLLAVGDISLARYIEEKMKNNNDYTLPFANVADFLRSADITSASFNNAILPGRVTPKDSMILRTDPKSVAGLTAAGFDLLNVANNQVMGYQASKMFQTLDALHGANIKTVGAGANINDAHTPAIFDVKGKKIAFYGYVDSSISPKRDDSAKEDAPGLAMMDIEAMKNDVKNALTQADFVVVMMHAGVEYKEEPTQFQKDFAHAAIDAGASVVIGTHPHVVQPVEVYGKGVIFYSLGNFLFDQYFSDNVRNGLAAKIYFPETKGEAPTYKLFPVRADSYQPYIKE